MLFLWWKYRLGSDSAYTYISCISFLSYVDFIPFLTGEYLLLGLLCRIFKKEENFTGGFGIDEPITRSEDDLLGRKYMPMMLQKSCWQQIQKKCLYIWCCCPLGKW